MRVKKLNFLILALVFLAGSNLLAEGTNQAPRAKTSEERIADLEAKVKLLESEIVKLWRYGAAIDSRRLDKTEVTKLIDRQASLLINRYLGGQGDDPTRMPLVSSEGGIKLENIIVGKDRTSEPLGSDGLRITVVARGPKKNGDALVTIYALPPGDQVLRPGWLVYADGNVPYLDGVVQTHFHWKGIFADGRQAEPGKYRVFVRVIVTEAKGERLGGAMRWWGGANNLIQIEESKQ